MIIDKSWFYDISNILDTEIIINENLVVSIYDAWIYTRKIYLWFNSIVDIFDLFIILKLIILNFIKMRRIQI